MGDITQFTLQEAHEYFAKSFNNSVWDLLEKKSRTADENELLLHAAHASCAHWLAVGTPLHHQRAQWLLSRVHCVLGRVDDALRHAERCQALTEKHADLMQDFDRAYAFEALACAYALAGKTNEAQDYFKQAKAAGLAIADVDDKEYFMGDLESGQWYGLE